MPNARTLRGAYFTYLRQLSDDNIKELLSFSLKRAGINFSAQQLDMISEHLDGHPFNVRFATQFIDNYGIDSIIADPSDLIEWKRRRAEDFLSKIDFDQIESDVIAVLNEYRYVATDTLVTIITGDPADIAKSLRRLEELCCVERREGYYHIPGPIREALRRDIRFEKPDSWKQAVAKGICDTVLDYQNDDHIPIQIIESATIAAARGMASAPAFLVNLILPSHLLRIARDYYDREKRLLCMEFCKRAYEARSRLTIDGQIEALRLWGLSAVRLGDNAVYEMALERLQGYGSSVARRVRFFWRVFSFAFTIDQMTLNKSS